VEWVDIKYTSEMPMLENGVDHYNEVEKQSLVCF